MATPSLSTGRIVGIVIGVVVMFVLGFVIGWVSAPSEETSSKERSPSFDMKYIREKREQDAKEKEIFHKKLLEILNAENIGENLRLFSKRPHVGGTPRSKFLADEIEKRWREYKFDKVEQPKYNILLPFVQPNVSNSVKVINSSGHVTFEFSGREKLADPSENDTTMIAPLLGYAKEGSVEGPLLYVNYGRREDFDVLKNLDIFNCTGYIVIMRYGKIYRGDKVKHAQECGAKGAILYNDPADSAPEGIDKVYPKYIWLPKTGVQRGSILNGRGDPLTPGLPSIDGVFRLPMHKANLPKIPATPMPYGDAIEVMKLMKGRDVPVKWKGALDITYKLGDGGIMDGKKVKITVNVPIKRQDAYNVIGTIYGKEEPDRWVMLGNHRDAWGFGAVDACSGTSAMMELSRGLSELLKQGWRPRRTIKFCSWGAEESGLLGSTEWVEENERALATKGITYINIDIAVYGNKSMFLSGSPLLKTRIKENVKEVNDPKGGSVYEQMENYSSKFTYRNLGSGSDYASFYQFIGVPSLDMTYGEKTFYPVYHSVHDTYKWLQGLIDPFFQFHLTTTRVAARFLLAVADSLVLPLDVTQYGKSLNISLKTFKESHGNELSNESTSLSGIENAIKKYNEAAAKFEKEKSTAAEEKDDIRLRELNDRMVNVEKCFITAAGLPNRPNTRHVAFAPSVSNAYGSTSFPGVSDLMVKANKTEDDWLMIKRQLSIVFTSISSATQTLQADGN